MQLLTWLCSVVQLSYMHHQTIKDHVIRLRKRGYSYNALQEKFKISKATLSSWLSQIELSDAIKQEMSVRALKNLLRARERAVQVNDEKRRAKLEKIRDKNLSFRNKIHRKDYAKIALSMLYLGEGGKQGGSISFGNSNPEIIKTFLGLLRTSYNLDEKKFRATVQCRADQNIPELEKFWSSLTHIPHEQFYHAQVDQRTQGKPSRKTNYKGVCRIDYFSAAVFNELAIIAEIVSGALSSVG